MKVLAINTYGGSLLIGAQLAGAELVATMEDSGFGSDIQALNFPNVPNYPTRAEWPEGFAHEPWEGSNGLVNQWPEVDVIAHPPCAAFSGQNSSKDKRGKDTDAFNCHTDVIKYALGHGARTLAIESVLGAYDGASEVYEQLAMEHDYTVTYIFLNSAGFALPQWRPRMWAIFHQTKDPFRVDYHPEYRNLASVLDPCGTEWELKGGPGKVWEKIKPLVRPEWPSGVLPAVVEKVYGIPKEPNFKGARDRFDIRGFTTSHVRLVKPEDFASVVLYDQALAVGTRLLTIEEYCSIMGFPREYRWGRRQKQFRLYLSKGVCPPIAAWILRMMDRNASGWEGPSTHEENDFGGIIDLRPNKAEAYKLANQVDLSELVAREEREILDEIDQDGEGLVPCENCRGEEPEPTCPGCGGTGVIHV